MSRPVPFVGAVSVTYRVIIRQLVTTGRVLALGVLGAAVTLIGWAVGRGGDERSAVEQLDVGLDIVSQVAFTFVVPIVALVFASAALGDTREDGTLVYLWLRPMPRSAVVVGAWLAALTVSAPLTILPSTATAAALDAGGGLVGATFIAAAVGVVAYSAIFVLLGLLVKNGIVWGLVYVILWEGVVALLGGAAARIAIRGYTSSILTARTGGELTLGIVGQVAGIVVPLVVAVVALAMATYRLNNLEVA